MADQESSSGGGPYGEYAHFKHWIGPLLYLVAVIVAVLALLIGYWPRCEVRTCPGACLPGGKTALPAASTTASGVTASEAAPPAASGALAAVEPANPEASAGGAANVPLAPSASAPPVASAPVTIAVPIQTAATSSEAVVVTSVTPTTGNICGGTPVMIATRPLPAGAYEVLFGGIPALDTTISKDRTSIVARTPSHWDGPVDVSVSVGESSSSLVNAFRYACSDQSQALLLFLIVLAGALGGALHALRSIFYFIGNRELRVSWLASYIAMPFTGAAVGAMFFLVFVAGFFMPQEGDAKTYFLMVGVAALVGMFTPQAVQKLKTISEAILTTAKDAERSRDSGPNAKPPPPVMLNNVLPPTGPAAGGTSATVHGTGFQQGAVVSFGGVQATVTATSADRLVVTLPPHAAGKVDVEVKNTDGTGAKKVQGFEYT